YHRYAAGGALECGEHRRFGFFVWKAIPGADASQWSRAPENEKTKAVMLAALQKRQSIPALRESHALNSVRSADAPVTLCTDRVPCHRRVGPRRRRQPAHLPGRAVQPVLRLTHLP